MNESISKLGPSASLPPSAMLLTSSISNVGNDNGIGVPTRLTDKSSFEEWMQRERKVMEGAGDRKLPDAPTPDPLQEAFQDFVGQTLFSQLIASMRTSQQEPAYFHGGQAERVFQGQLDQILTEEMSRASAKSLAEPMFELFQLRRQ